MEQPVLITGKSGKVYRKTDNLPFCRYGKMEALSIEMAYARSVQDLFASQKRAYELLDKQKLADAAVEMHNCMMGAARVADGKPHPAAMLCMLFWNNEDEDKAITDEQLLEKVADVSHMDASFFFVQAAISVPGLLAAFKARSRDFSEALEGLQSASEQTTTASPAPSS